jgi:hypothetical protein
MASASRSTRPFSRTAPSPSGSTLAPPVLRLTAQLRQDRLAHLRLQVHQPVSPVVCDPAGSALRNTTVERPTRTPYL